ncbi:MAG: hypothetical protein ACJ8FY_18340 [Gemmataceae bacterium]
MDLKNTLGQREKELQALIKTPAGRAEIEELSSRYGAVSGRIRPERSSAITYILVHERQIGLIAG